jgi:hypothetical protein
VLAQFDIALDRLDIVPPTTPGSTTPGSTTPGSTPGRTADDRGVEELSVVLAKAEFLAASPVPAERAEAVLLGERALRITNRVRGRMRVIARSRAPLAVAFRRLYGDIALLAARLSEAGTPDAADLGLRVALSAKQTGFAARIRADRNLMNDFVFGVLQEIVEIEDRDESDASFVAGDAGARLEQLHFKLKERVSSTLAETVLPVEVDLGEVRETLGARHALDYLELPHSLAGPPVLFRSLTSPGRPVCFERFTPDTAVADFFTSHRASRDLYDGISRDMVPHGATERRKPPTWAAMASLLPEPLLKELLVERRDRTTPVPLVISAHSWLSIVPWAAVEVGVGVRLVERALVTQTPVLTCLTGSGPAAIDGAGLVRLVGVDHEGSEAAAVTVSRERVAWGLTAGSGGVPLSRADVRSGQVPVPLPETRLTDVLTKDAGWAFLHVASHGGAGPEEEAEGERDGLRQRLLIPEQQITAAHALAMYWPTSVLMASCHVGQVVNAKDAEPLNFVMAQLTGGARCVVAGIASIADKETGNVAHHIIRAVRDDGRSLDEALRSAQLDAIERKADAGGWARCLPHMSDEQELSVRSGQRSERKG